jgi:hypothetical protein
VSDSLNIKYSIQRIILKSGNSYSTIRIVNIKGIYAIYKYLYPNGFEFGLKRKFDKCVDIINQPIYNTHKERIFLF